MTTFEWSILALILLGFVVPLWTMTGIFIRSVLSTKKVDPGSRYEAYVRAVDRLFDEMNRESNRAAVILASLRELRNYPEYRDISVMLLGIIDVNGKTHFDEMCSNELKVTEAFLLEVHHD